MASMASQSFLLQREVTPGTPVTDAMRSYQGLRGRPGFEVDGETFTPSGYRAGTFTPTEEYGRFEVEAPQCFNAMLPVLASTLGAPVSTPDGNVPTAATHEFVLKSRGERTPVTFTTIWGGVSFAFESSYFAFNELTYGVQRSELTFETSGVGRTPDETVTFPSTGITEVPAQVIPARAYDVYIDDTWDDIGTTKYLACYDASVSIGETWGRDTPINSAIVSFSSLVENEEIDFEGEMQVGLDAAAQELFSTFRSGALKYVRIAALGPVIGDDVRYRIEIDYPIRITSPGTVETAPNSPTVVMPFAYRLAPSSETDNLIRVSLTNTVLSL